MADSEFCRLLRRYRKERHLTQQALLDKLKSQGYSYTESAISRWESGKRRPPADVVEALEDILGSPRSWLLKAAGYRADAQIRLSPVVDPAQAKHFQELSVTALILVSNFESYLENFGGFDSPVGQMGSYHTARDAACDGWMDIDDLDKSEALNLLCHLKKEEEEFPDLANVSCWGDLTTDKISDDFIARLKLKVYREVFMGKCPACPNC